jgi:ferredoxin
MLSTPVAGKADPSRALVATSPIVARVDVDLCSGCGSCVAVCPSGALSVDRVAAVDLALCTACSACVLGCPNQAIALVRAPARRGAAG